MKLFDQLLSLLIQAVLRFTRYVLMTAIVSAYTIPIFAAIMSIIAISTGSSTVMLGPTLTVFAKTIGVGQVMNGAFIVLTIIAIVRSVRNAPAPQVDARTYAMLSALLVVSAAIFIALSRDTGALFPFFAAFVFGSISYWTYAGTTFLQNKLLEP